ncbi:MAG: DUF998 domain-containing protein [Pseudomonadota bacterium]
MSHRDVLSYKAVRQFLGALGIALPVMLLIYCWVSDTSVRKSISDFYHTPMGDVLVGVMVAIGVFLLSYKGFAKEDGDGWLTDRRVSIFAGLGAIGVGIFPVHPTEVPLCPEGQNPPGSDAFCNGTGFAWHADYFHYGSALTFFFCLILFCFVLFRRGIKARRDLGTPKDTDVANNATYLLCGTIIAAMLVLMFGIWLNGKFLHWAWLSDKTVDWKLMFWAEVVGVVAFGVSWLTKGKTIASVKAAKLAIKARRAKA